MSRQAPILRILIFSDIMNKAKYFFIVIFLAVYSRGSAQGLEPSKFDFKGYLKYLTSVNFQDVDDVWHTHVLMSKKYFADCATVYGYYLHHNPVIRDGREELEPYHQGFDETMNLFMQHYADQPPVDHLNLFDDGTLNASQMVCKGNGDCAPGIGPIILKTTDGDALAA